MMLAPVPAPLLHLGVELHLIGTRKMEERSQDLNQHSSAWRVESV